MQKLTALLLILTSSTFLTRNSYAEDAVLLTKGSPAPFEGFLIDRPKALEFRGITFERDEYKLLNESLTKSLQLYKDNDKINGEKLSIVLTQNDKLAQELNSARSTSNWEKTLWFLGGVVITGAAFYGAAKLYKP